MLDVMGGYHIVISSLTTPVILSYAVLCTGVLSMLKMFCIIGFSGKVRGSVMYLTTFFI